MIKINLLPSERRTVKKKAVFNIGQQITAACAGILILAGSTVGWRLWQRVPVRLSVDVPFMATPAFTVTTPEASLPLEYASLYLTPGIRVTVIPRGPVSFFGVVGAGYARYSESRLRADRSANPDQRQQINTVTPFLRVTPLLLLHLPPLLARNTSGIGERQPTRSPVLWQ